MSILVIAEHTNTALRPSTLHAIGAARKLGSDIAVLVAGHSVAAVVNAVAA